MVSTKLLDENCWPDWPQWECYGANIAGLLSTGMWFVVLLPQVLKNWWRRSVVGLSFLWAVANFTASLVNLFFAFYVQVPLYVRVSAVYMPILEFTILCQFMIYSKKALTTKLLVLLVCLLVWGTIVEVELNLSQSRDKIQWVAMTLWSVETFPQVILNIKRQSTSGQATTSVLIALAGKTTDFIVTYGLAMPLPYVVMCYFSSSSAFINGFQVFYYGWNTVHPEKLESESGERTKLLKETHGKTNAEKLCSTHHAKKLCPWFATILRLVGMTYVSLGLIAFAVGFFWRTKTYLAILGPFACFAVVFTATEYYRLKRKGHLKRCEEARDRFGERCGFVQDRTSMEQNGDAKYNGSIQ